jgi:hypothetical protein
MRRPALFRYLYTGFAVVTIAAAPANVGGQQPSIPKLRELRRLNPGAAVCVNPPMNIAGGEIDIARAGDELAQRVRDAGFVSGPLGTLSRCDALVFTEITMRSRQLAELDFRVVLTDEQIPRLCSSARGKSAKGESWRSALARAFGDEAGQILKAQQKGMAIYPGALEYGR